MATQAEITDPVAYSFGLVAGGYLILVLPGWGLSALWNRLVPKRTINPWILPLACLVLLGLCFLIAILDGKGDIDDPMILTGFIPAALFCPLAAWRWRRPDPVDEELSVHRDPGK
ncbi:hypothetical protein JST97_20755 [bacterium]|nr:hypothetical protein [bacterium]